MIPIYVPWLGDKEIQNVSEAVRSGWISSRGRFVDEFEDRFAKYLGTKQAVAVSSGTAALHLALLAVGCRRRDEVIVPSLTFIATGNSVRYVEARPVFADSDSNTWCMDISKLDRYRSNRTKIIIPVHLYGHPVDLGPILELAEDHSLKVVEDAAEALGATYRGRKVGSIGDIGCFSFYANKVITTGEGGMCVTNDEELASKIRLLRDQGQPQQDRYWHPVIGYNYRVTNLQAALGVAQLEKIDEILKKKRAIARLYKEQLSSVEGISTQPEAEWAESIFWLNSILVNSDFPKTRDQLTEYLKRKGIDTRPFFTPLHLQPAYQRYIRPGSFLPVSEKLSLQGINLPSYPTLTDKEVIYVTEAISTATKDA